MRRIYHRTYRRDVEIIIGGYANELITYIIFGHVIQVYKGCVMMDDGFQSGSAKKIVITSILRKGKVDEIIYKAYDFEAYSGVKDDVKGSDIGLTNRESGRKSITHYKVKGDGKWDAVKKVMYDYKYKSRGLDVRMKEYIFYYEGGVVVKTCCRKYEDLNVGMKTEWLVNWYDTVTGLLHAMNHYGESYKSGLNNDKRVSYYDDKGFMTHCIAHGVSNKNKGVIRIGMQKTVYRKRSDGVHKFISERDVFLKGGVFFRNREHKGKEPKTA